MRNGAGVRPKIVVATPWPVWPLTNGRRTKVFARCVGWSQIADVEIISAGASAADEGTVTLGSGIVERRVGFTADYEALERTPLTVNGERAAFFAAHLTKNVTYGEILRERLASASLAIACTPFTYAVVRERTALPIILDCQVIEADAVFDLYADDAAGREVQGLISRIEHEAVANASHILVATEEDHLAAVQRGANCASVTTAMPTLFRSTDTFPTRQQRRALKDRSNFSGSPLVVFAGSATRGNATCLSAMLRTALRLPQIRFLAIGTIAESVRGRPVPPNIGFTGFIDDAQFTTALMIADAGIEIAPITRSSSAKVEAYIRAGAPVIANPDIARRSALPDGHYIASKEREIVDVIRTLLQSNDEAALDEPESAFRLFFERARNRNDVSLIASLIGKG